jgi:hypothetical protein
VKEFLSRANAPFTARNVDEDDAAYDELIARGYRSVPVTLFGDHAVKGYDVPALTDALARWRAQS